MVGQFGMHDGELVNSHLLKWMRSVSVCVCAGESLQSIHDSVNYKIEIVNYELLLW